MSVPPMMTRIYGLNRIFQIVISNKIEDPYDLSFKVVHIFRDDCMDTPIKQEKLKDDATCSTLLHKPIFSSSRESSKRTFDFSSGESSRIDDASEDSHAIELPVTTITVGQLQVNLPADELSVKKTCTRFVHILYSDIFFKITTKIF